MEFLLHLGVFQFFAGGVVTPHVEAATGRYLTTGKLCMKRKIEIHPCNLMPVTP